MSFNKSKGDLKNSGSKNDTTPSNLTNENISLPQPPALRRRKASNTPKPLIVVYCEGKTEEKYLEDLSRNIGTNLVEIEAIGEVGVPKTMAEIAVKRKRALEGSARRYKSDSFDSFFVVWVMFDRDEHKNIPFARDLAYANGVKVAFSNPCFELWAYLHFEDHDADTHRHVMQKMLTKYMPEYDHDDNPILDYNLMKDKFKDAKNRAKDMRQRRIEQGEPDGCPYTDVDLLIEQILAKSGKLPSKESAVDEIKSEIRKIESSPQFNDGDTEALKTRSDLYKRLKIIMSDS